MNTSQATDTLANAQTQVATIKFVAEMYRSISNLLGIEINREALIPDVDKVFKAVYENQGLKPSQTMRPLTTDEEFILLADYAVTEFRAEMHDKMEGKENFLEVKNGTLIPLLSALGSEMMQHFLGILSVEVLKKFGTTSGLPLAHLVDGVFMLALFVPVEDEDDDYAILKGLGISPDRVATIFPKRSKYNN